MRNMSYRNHYSGSPWQQGGPPFGVGNYGQNYGGYNDNYPMMNTGYGRNQGGYGGGGGGGGMYGSGGMGQMRSMGGYGGPSPSRHYGSDRMGGGSRSMMSRGQMQRKRLPQRSPAGGPRSKRPNLGIVSDRRSSKPRRRRESRGGSKGRGRGTDEDEAYNPAEPTDDASDIEYVDGFESWPTSEVEDNDVGGDQKAKENGDQNLDEVTADGENKDDSSAPVKAVQKKLICYVCKVTCSSESKYRNHQNSDTHKTKINELVSARREKRQGSQEDDKGSDKESKDSKKKVRKPGNWCTVCECVFNGNFLAHRRTKEHRKKRDKKYPKCRPCRMGFSSSEEYRDHYKSEDHKLKSAEFHYLKGLASGSDDDEEAIRPVELEPLEDEIKEEPKSEEPVADDGAAVVVVKTEEGAEKVEVKIEKTEDGAEGEGAAAEKKDQDKKEAEAKEKKKPREPKALGQSFVISVQGYYCKLCRKFFKNVSMAKSKHCRSIMHQGAYKKAMEDALIQEEERQKLAEEQDKLDREAAEAAELAADIAAVEKAAKEAVKREAAKKKAELQKGQDVEMKEEIKDGQGDDVDHNKAAVSDEKMDTGDQKLENGTKDQAESEESSTKDSKDDKSQEEKSGGDTQEESADGEEELDEEPEKAKEEVTTSPATRRGRGRGRGRKRR